MAFDEVLAGRVVAALEVVDGVVERKMFGGLAYMVRGNMAAGIIGDRLMVRVGAEDYEVALAEPHCGPMDFTGRPMRGFVVVEAVGIASESGLKGWVDRGVAYADSLPPK